MSFGDLSVTAESVSSLSLIDQTLMLPISTSLALVTYNKRRSKCGNGQSESISVKLLHFRIHDVGCSPFASPGVTGLLTELDLTAHGC